MIQRHEGSAARVRRPMASSFETAPPGRTGTSEESLVVDDRSSQSPAEEVEERLLGLLDRVFVPVSHIRHRSLTPTRSFPREN